MDDLWNIDECGPMTEADYDTIIAKGWSYVSEELYKRIGFDPSQLAPPKMEYAEQLRRKLDELGKTSIERGMTPFAPFECLSGARKLSNWIRDLRRFPDKVRTVLDVVEDAVVEQTIKQLKSGPPCEYGSRRRFPLRQQLHLPGHLRAVLLPVFPQTDPRHTGRRLQDMAPHGQRLERVPALLPGVRQGFVHLGSGSHDRHDEDQGSAGDKMCITGDVPAGAVVDRHTGRVLCLRQASFAPTWGRPASSWHRVARFR